MPSLLPSDPLPGLDAFLAALRFHGVPIGAQEVLWLHHAFRQAPTLDRQGLYALLACTLIKHAAHRESFTTLFDTWCPDETAPAPSVPPAPLPTPALDLPLAPALEPAAVPPAPTPAVPSMAPAPPHAGSAGCC